MQREGATNILIILVSASINALIFGPSHRGTCAFCIWTSIKITVSLKVREKRTFITLSLQCIWYPGSKSKKAKKKNKITKYSFASLHNLQIQLSCDRSPSIKTRKMQRKSFIFYSSHLFSSDLCHYTHVVNPRLYACNMRQYQCFLCTTYIEWCQSDIVRNGHLSI